MLNHRPARRAAMRGLSIVELMVGVVIGMIVCGAALLIAARNVASSRLMLSEVRVNQDLRAVADLIQRDLRRAAFWGNAITGTNTTATTTVPPVNPYAAIAADSSSLTYAFTRDATEDDTLGGNEQFGFRLASGRVEMQTADGVWQPVNDPNAVTVTALSLTPVTTTLPLGHLCPITCGVGTPNCPTVTVRRFDFTLRGQSARDANVVRELRGTVRVRNDQFSGRCPG